MERSGELPARVNKRLVELQAEYGLSEENLDQFRSILLSLAGEHAPTAVTDALEGINVHIADSLTALGLEDVKNAKTIADLGSGCGIPGLVLASALPESRVIAVDAQKRRCEFISNAAEAAGLKNVETVWSRAEEWDAGHGICDLVTARAMASLPVLVEYSSSLLREGGLMVAWKGKLEGDEKAQGAVAAELTGMSEPEVIQVEPWRGGGRRKLVLSRKIAPTPDRFPRRAGIAVKRPLGS
ncbi:MAG: 16S rRNA (guanine(527)-N(7))-methyltransferase RsmG [Actinobacteria bacterium]|uniref:Unannotated protein n=1 Tax=freshwater metagenome TaxID=449393 RepID=A0A6J7DGR2_9ZZZZ|nr:16S rRNA (guanine(527)-N(7))-methyltransferase RsmG [Actinomycetota bacterium]